MFETIRSVQLSETDATGAIYFTQQLKWAQEALLAATEFENDSLFNIMDEENCALPVVHSEADFFAPIFLGDSITIQVKTAHISEHSFGVESTFFKNGGKVGQCLIVHVVVSRETGETISISERLAHVLNSISSECGSEEVEEREIPLTPTP